MRSHDVCEESHHCGCVSLCALRCRQIVVVSPMIAARTQPPAAWTASAALR